MSQSTTLTDTVTEAFEDIRDKARSAAQRRRKNAFSALRDAPYAAIGSLSTAMERTRTLARQLAELPARARKQLSATPDQVRETYRERVEAGHSVVDRVLGRKSTQRARKSVKQARAAAKSAGSSLRKAARNSADAVAGAVDSVESGSNLPYEERTVSALYELASSRDIEGRSQMNKQELIEALRSER